MRAPAQDGDVPAPPEGGLDDGPANSVPPGISGLMGVTLPGGAARGKRNLPRAGGDGTPVRQPPDGGAYL
ncbi:hypothetical protein GCM10020295_60620 [Streptomyces cinereospinus]